MRDIQAVQSHRSYTYAKKKLFSSFFLLDIVMSDDDIRLYVHFCCRFLCLIFFANLCMCGCRSFKWEKNMRGKRGKIVCDHGIFGQFCSFFFYVKIFSFLAIMEIFLSDYNMRKIELCVDEFMKNLINFHLNHMLWGNLECLYEIFKAFLMSSREQIITVLHVAAKLWIWDSENEQF